MLVNGDEVLDARFSESPDVEDEDYDNTKTVDQSRWTCYRECVGELRSVKTKAAVVGIVVVAQENPWKRFKVQDQ